METVSNSRLFLRATRSQRHLHYTVLRRELFSSGRFHAGQQSGVDRRRAPAANHERHRVHMHTTLEPPHNGHDVRDPDGYVDGRLRHVRTHVRFAEYGRPAVQLDAAGVHIVQRQRQHVGYGSTAVDDDRRIVPVEGPGHHGRPGAFVGVLFHIRHGENVAQSDDGARQGSDHVAVRRRRRSGRLFHRGVFAGDSGEELAANRKVVQQRPDEKH